MLTNDLKAASAAEPASKPRKSWKKSETPAPSATPGIQPGQQLPPSQPVISRGFDGASGAPDFTLPDNTPRWFTDEELGLSNAMVDGSYGGGAAGVGSGFGTSPGNMNTFGSMMFNHAGPSFDPTNQPHRGHSDQDSPASITATSPSAYGNTGVGISQPPHSSVGTSQTSNPIPMSLTLPHSAAMSNTPDQTSATLSTSAPRQRRRLNTQSPLVGTSNLIGTDVDQLKSMAYGFTSQTKQGMPATAINHTGTASYSLSEDAELTQAGEGEENTHTISELADVVGQLSLNENAEVRYHGR